MSGTWSLIRLALRRDRIALPAWILGIFVMAISGPASFQQLYPTQAERTALAQTIDGNPAMVGVYGRIYDVADAGGLATWKTAPLCLVLVALMSLFTVMKHTRAEEESGRRELVGAGVVGRSAPLTAAILVALGANLLLAVITVLAFLGSKMPVDGTLYYGAAFFGGGAIFTALAAVLAQLTESARSANGIGVAVLAVTYVLRAAGDSGTQSWPTWLSPIGWTQQVRPFADQRPWVFLLIFGAALALLALAYALAARRDIAAGALPTRLGAPEGSWVLSSSFGLAWRLQRGGLFGWTLGFALGGLAAGTLAKDVSSMLAGNQQMADLLHTLGGARSFEESYLSLMFSILGIVASVYAVSAVLRLRAEETEGRAEPVLATGVGRLSWSLSHIAFALLGSAVLMTALGLTAGLAYGSPATLLGAALVQLPAIWLLAGLTVALFGLLPRLSSAAWAALVVFLLIGELGGLLKLDQWIMDISPYSHIPKLPGESVSWSPLIWLTAIAAVLLTAGLTGIRRRDLTA
ncbi:ABC transporter permease [Pseudonocardiaceae bacterium YIM PH 21723]|nr:ABC transporter permease [Pseudonocardiaceae bacterium YIM PH 21723]